MTKTKIKQANFSLPGDLLEQLRREVPKGQQSQIVAEALRKELLRKKFRNALKNAFAAWEPAQHPELKDGTDKFIRRIRRSTRSQKA